MKLKVEGCRAGILPAIRDQKGLITAGKDAGSALVNVFPLKNCAFFNLRQSNEKRKFLVDFTDDIL